MNLTEFKALIEQIHEDNSLTIIHYVCDNAWSGGPLLDSQKKILHAIQDTNDLDEIRLICARELGLTAEVVQLTAWLKTKKSKAKR